MHDLTFDVVVIGGGHAGTEAAAAASRMGARTALLTQRLDRIGEMSCNPSIGGIGKGHLVREVDALDGIMGRAADGAGIHFKLLNRSKGPAVRGPRAQADRGLYRDAVQGLLRGCAGLSLLEESAEDLIFDSSHSVCGVVTAGGSRLVCGAVVLTTGTFLRGVIHVGHHQTPAGRAGEPASVGLAHSLARLGLPLGRLKTGTPPRLDRATIDWDGLPADRGDSTPSPFSFLTDAITTPQVECRITGTTPATHEVIRENLTRSAIYGGGISGRGPRYCPSIEDKVVRFADRERHQIFLEPEGLPESEHGDTVYPNGISTSLPADIQAAFIATIPGLEHARITRPGYAVEYDFVNPTALDPSFEVRGVRGLFLAGQINGTTGYEEAAAQGVLAGINAARRAGGGDVLILDRASSYIGVLAGDLTTAGVSEPYRMFTSRAEFRLTLRCDNADLRLTPWGIAAGCIGAERQSRFAKFADETAAALGRAKSDLRQPTALAAAGLDVKQDGQPRGVLDLLRHGFAPGPMHAEFPWLTSLSARVREQLEIESLYGGYVTRQASEVRQLRATETVELPADLDYESIPGLSNEARETLRSVRPRSLGALNRIQGITPTASMAIIGHLRRELR
jgi:tRNA uridine 5-carboxymethylaminomethyl modification enzyme